MTVQLPYSPGSIVGGIYRIRRPIGHGGMGEVYAAESSTGSKVALKVLHERAAQDPDLVARFTREAEVAKRIASPYVAAVLGSGKEKDGRLWIAFERLIGQGLEDRLRREQYLSFAEVAPIIEDALEGLLAAHAAGVVHRDIKPANLFIEKRELTREQLRSGEPEERTRILDFGVSKMKEGATKRTEPSLTAIDATVGSFAYMAPEQVRGSARADERADLYALGVVAFRALAGRLPFDGTNALTLVALKLDREAPSLAQITGDAWPAAIEQFLTKIMARDREHRFASAKEALEGWRQLCRLIGNPSRRAAPSLPPRVYDRDDVTAAHTLTDAVSIPAGGPLPMRRR